MEEADGSLAHAEGEELLEATVTPDIANRGYVESFVEDLPVEGWNIIFAFSPDQLHRSDLLGDHRLVFGVSELTLLENLFQQCCLSVTFVDTERAVCQKNDNPIQRYRMPNRLDILRAGWWIQGALVLLPHSLDERAVVAAFADSEAHLVLSVLLEAIEASLDLLNLSIDGKVVPQNCMDGVGCDSRALSHEYSKLLLSQAIQTDVREPISRNMEHVKLLELVQGPYSYRRVQGCAQ